MRKLFLKISLVLLGLVACVNTMWGQFDMLGEIDAENPASWFYVNLTANVSDPGCGTTTPGKVWLIYTTANKTAKRDAMDNPIPLLDEHGNEIPVLDENGNPTGDIEYVMERKAAENKWITGPKPTNPYEEYGTDDWNYRQWSEEYGFGNGLEDAMNGLTEKNYRSHYANDGYTSAIYEGYDAAWDWYKSGHWLNAENPSSDGANPSGWGTSASLNGCSMIYAPGFDDIEFFGIVVSAYAYFYGKAYENDGWYFTGWSYAEGENDLGGVVGVADSTMFRVLPAANAGLSNIRYENVYATFQPVLVSNYKVNGLINTSASNTTTVTFDVVGERVSAADFTVSVSHATDGDADGNWSAAITSCVNNKVTVTVTYSGSSNGEWRGNVTLASKSGCSELTAPVYARVGVNGSVEAILYDGKTPTATSGTLSAMITAANGTDKIVTLNKNIETATNVNANVTINFNGYKVNNTLTVSGGEVTVAYSKYGGGADEVSVTGGKLILNGGDFTSLTVGSNGTVEQNGATFAEAATNNGTLTVSEGVFEAGLTSGGSLTIDGGLFEGATALTVSGGTATINKAAISGSAYGIESKGGTTTITNKLVSVYGGTNAIKRTSGTVTLQNGKFDGATPLAGTISLQSGYFKVDGAHIGISVPSGKTVINVLAGTEYAEGYRYFVGDNASGVGVCRIGRTSYTTLEDALAYANNNPTRSVVIIMTNNYTLPAGYYTLPRLATLIIPMNNEQETGFEIINRVSNNSRSSVPYVQPYEFRRLTFANGVNIDVHGTIEVTCTQRASDDAYAAMPHGPYGHLVMAEGSHMTLQNGSTLRVWGYMTGTGETDARRGSTIREQFQMGDWKGGGQSFNMLDLSKNPGRVFPITQYFIQNIESPVKYHPGAVLSTTTSVSAAQGGIALTAMANDIKVVGVTGVDEAMFLMDNEADAENTWVRKWYNPATDVQTYDVNSGAHIGSMVLNLGKLGTEPLVMNSAQFVLPITNNMKIHLRSGSMDFTQSTALLPGAEVEVDKESTVTITCNRADRDALSAWVEQHDDWQEKKTTHDDWENNGSVGDEPENPGEEPVKPALSSGELYIYDADDWDTYACGKENNTFEKGKYTKVVKYSPTIGGRPSVRNEETKPGDASINVHGTFDTGDGTVYTTTSGANIFSSNADAGTFIITHSAPTYTSAVSQVKEGNKYRSTEAVSALLKNGAGAEQPFTETAGAQPNRTFMYINDEWYGHDLLFYFDCFAAEVDMTKYIAEAQKRLQGILSGHPEMFPYDLGSSVNHIYIKPQEWLEIVGTATINFNYNQSALMTAVSEGQEAIANYWTECAMQPYLVGVEGNSDHTFSDAAGDGRLFILMDKDCQWWEVEKKDNLYHCLHPQNDTYYYWDENRMVDDELNPGWVEKRFTITWKNWNGTVIEFENADGDPITYDVTYGTMAEYLGSNPTREADIDYTYNFTGWSPTLGPVTQDVTYTATYESQPRKYTIIFQQEGGVEIERQFLTHNEVPVCNNTPTKVGHTLQWSPAIAAVTGDATYTATWLEEPPTEYEVTFFDYNGTTVLKQSDVAVGAMPTAPTITNGIPAGSTGKPATSEYTYVFDHWSPTLEAVSATSIKSYTAIYREVAKTYTVIFQNENGSEIERHEYVYGATPVCSNTPTKANTAEWTYGFAWSPQIQTVQSAATYRATFPATKNKYTVTLKSNNEAVCTFTGAGIYDYGTEVTIGVNLLSDDYEFAGWQEDESLSQSFTTTVTGDITLTAKVVLVGMDETADMFLDVDFADPIPDGMTINVRDLVLTSDGMGQSAQLLGNVENLKIWGDAIFWLRMPMMARTWYAIGVPWTVDVAQGVYSFDAITGQPTVHQIVANTFDIVALNSAANAAGKDPKDCWTYVDLMDGLLHPGKAYLIYLTSDQPQGLLFYKKHKTPLLTTTTNVITTGGSGSRDNWNAIANPALFHATLETGALIGQKYDGETDSYMGGSIDGYPWIVADPIFVQATTPKTVVAEVYEGGGLGPGPGPLLPTSARRNLSAESGLTDIHCTIELSHEGKLTDRLFVATTDEKDDAYTIGQDVAKMGISNKIAQMWVNRYDAKLCMNTIEPITDRAEYPLAIFAPKAGEYVISLKSSESRNPNATLYLTRNGEAICNLSERDYVLQLDKGTTNEYGLRISARSPQVATGCDEVIADGAEGTQKVLVNDKIYIIRGNEVYSIDGRLIK